MTGEIIEVCQHCGHLIEPEDVTAPWGARYRITLCVRDECLSERLGADLTESFRRDAAERWERDLRAMRLRHIFVPTINRPESIIRITGV